MILKRLEESVPLFLALDGAAGIVAVELSILGDITRRAEMLFLPHHLFDTGM